MLSWSRQCSFVCIYRYRDIFIVQLMITIIYYTAAMKRPSLFPVNQLYIKPRLKGQTYSLVPFVYNAKRYRYKQGNDKLSECTIVAYWLKYGRFFFKALDTFGICQRPSPGASQYYAKITNLWKCGFNWSSNLQENERKTPWYIDVFAQLDEQ